MADLSQFSDQEILQSLQAEMQEGQPQTAQPTPQTPQVGQQALGGQQPSNQALSQFSDAEIMRSLADEHAQATMPQFTANMFKQQKAPTNFFQNLVLSLAVDDNARAEYLAQEFPGSQVGFNQEGQLTIDGARVNPKGFDVGDLSRNAGFSFNLGGQIVGSLLGMGVGTAGGAPGVVAGGIAGGTTGNVLGESIRIAVGDIFGLTTDEQAVLKRIQDEAIVGATGEALGFGIAGAGKLVGKSPIGKAVGNIWVKTIDKIRKKGFPLKSVLRFTSNIPEEATEWFQVRGFKKIPENLADPDKMSHIVNNTLFGQKFTTMSQEELMKRGKSGLEIGQEAIIKSIKEGDNAAYTDLLRLLSIVDEDAIATMKASDIRQLLKGTNVGDEGYLRLAKEIKDGLFERRLALGKEITRAINKAPSHRGYDFDDVAVFGDRLIRREFNRVIRQPGFQKKVLPALKGDKELRDFVDTFFGIRIKDITDPDGLVVREIAEEGKRLPLGFLRKGQVLKINNSIDAQVDSIMRNERIPAQIRDAVREIRNRFKESLYRQLGNEEQVARFAAFAELNDEIVGQGVDGVAARLKSMSLSGEAGKIRLRNALNGMQTAKGQKLLARMNQISAVEQVAKKSSAKHMDFFFRRLNSDKILSARIDSPIELGLDRIGQAMLQSGNPNVVKRAFLNEAKDFVAAQHFGNDSVNILRAQTLVSMAGLGAIGAATLGPFGAGLGLAGAVAINSRNVGKILATLDKASPTVKRKIAEKIRAASAGISRVGEKDAQAALRALLSRTLIP